MDDMRQINVALATCNPWGKFYPGELVLMKRASFSPVENVRVVLLYEHPDERMPCPLCDDPNCFEWANVLGEDGHYYYHVSDCQLQKLNYGRAIEETHAKLAALANIGDN
jgi:hypothetical protein